eukprot:Sdes_comp20868_c0_seq1m17776
MEDGSGGFFGFSTNLPKFEAFDDSLLDDNELAEQGIFENLSEEDALNDETFGADILENGLSDDWERSHAMKSVDLEKVHQEFCVSASANFSDPHTFAPLQMEDSIRNLDLNPSPAIYGAHRLSSKDDDLSFPNSALLSPAAFQSSLPSATLNSSDIWKSPFQTPAPLSTPSQSKMVPKMLTLEELENSFQSSTPVPTHVDIQPAPEPNPSLLKSRKNEAHELASSQPAADAAARSNRYANLMRDSEKQFLMKIQMSQLQTENPYVDDFYFQQYSLKQLQAHHGKRDIKILVPKLNPESHPKPREFPVLEGPVLGKITASSIRTPKTILETHASGKFSLPSSLPARFQALISSENGYRILLAIEDLEKQMGGVPISDRNQMLQMKDKLISALFDILTGVDSSHPEGDELYFQRILKLSKGQKLIARSLPLFSESQSVDVIAKVFHFLFSSHQPDKNQLQEEKNHSKGGDKKTKKKKKENVDSNMNSNFKEPDFSHGFVSLFSEPFSAFLKKKSCLQGICQILSRFFASLQMVSPSNQNNSAFYFFQVLKNEPFCVFLSFLLKFGYEKIKTEKIGQNSPPFLEFSNFIQQFADFFTE